MKKKIIAALLALTMVVSGIYFTQPEAEEVQASTSAISDTTEPDTADPDMLSIKMQNSATYTNEGETAERVDLRIVSSVNGLGYENVGFEVWYGDDVTVNADGTVTIDEANPTAKKVTKKVLKRVKATGRVAYDFSPKVVDTAAEYFVTATIEGILTTNFDKNFYVRAFCTPLDGTAADRVYGAGKLFTINEATAKINIPVAMTETQFTTATADGLTLDNVTVAGTTTTATVAGYIDGYAHLNVTVADKTALDSASKIVVGSGDDAPSAIYRNLETDYTGKGTEDTSWYTVYAEEGETAFVIATDADLYGFSSLSQSNNFSGATIYAVADIDANDGKGTASATEFTRSDSATLYAWTPIGGTTHNSSYRFSGTFDGQMHNISGLYFSENAAATVCYGLFGATNGATIQRFTLDNSYMCIVASTSYNVRLGCVGGYAVSSKFDTIKVANSVYAKNEAGKSNSSGHGGIIGYIDSTGATITNCWFDGQFTGGAGGLGGMVGYVKSAADTQIKNCLYTGKLIYAGANNIAGGICGQVGSSKLTIEDSLSIGTVGKYTDSVSSANLGAVIGYGAGTYSGESYVATVNKTYALVDNTWNRYISTGTSPKFEVDGTGYTGSIDAALTSAQTTKPRFMYQTNCVGATGYVNMNLDFTIGEDYAGYWSTTATGTPVLSSFVNAEDMLALDEVKTARTVWYDEAASDATEYTLYSMADMFGFASLTDETFADKTVKLGADITMNKGEASETGFTLDEEEQTDFIPWTPRDMAGTFDGNGHTIRGVYLNTATGNAGLFASVTGTVQDLRLRNSYINCTNNTANNYYSTDWLLGAGSIAGSLSGTLDTVYSDAIVKKTGAYVGGLVGTVYDATTDGTGTSTITNSCFAGKVQGTQVAGGLVGVVVTTATIDHCLNAGKVTADDLIGGLCAEVWTGGNLTVNDSLNVGRSSDSTIAWSGGMVGYVRGVPASLNNTYTIMYFANATGNWKNSVYRSSTGTLTFDGVPSTRQDESVSGWTEQAVLNKVNVSGIELALSFRSEEIGADNTNNYWVDIDGKIPMLASFEDLLTNVTY